MYRLFRDENHANQFLTGAVYLSTLGSCRAYEGLNGDKHEATHVRQIRHIDSSKDPGAFEREWAATGHPFPGLASVTVVDSTFSHVLPDGYVLCCTMRDDPLSLAHKFGAHCVEILEPERFVQLLAAKMLDAKGPKYRGHAGAVHYGERNTKQGSRPPGHIGFVKPRNPFEDEMEFRVLFPVDDATPISGFVLEVPDAAPLLRRIS